MTTSAKRILPYFHAMTPKSRLIIYLISTGKYTLDDVRLLTAEELSKARKQIPKSLDLDDICENLTMSVPDDAQVFRYSSGRPLSLKDLTNILKRSHKNAGTEYKGLKEFVEST